MSDIISATSLGQLVDSWTARGVRLVGPRRIKPGLFMYQPLESFSQAVLEGFIRPANSIKEFVFPRHEKLYEYQFNGKQIALTDAKRPAVEQVILGARSCDAAALAILDHVFNWDTPDTSYNFHRQRTTVITLACRESDSHCFCTSVGSGPADERGSDVMLYDLSNGSYEVRCLTEKGTKLFAGHTQPSNLERPAEPVPAAHVDMEAVRRFLAEKFEDPAWQAATQRCLGCGACAYTCPTCHCFDILDEGNSHRGSRARNWDACQFAQFTAHASGHNPRSVQSQRQRQRIFHKFKIYPEKFGDILCTGCGNCTRNCPVGLGVRTVLEGIASEQKK
jgi:ferredoxin